MPGSLKHLRKAGVEQVPVQPRFRPAAADGNMITVVYLGSGGLALIKDSSAILIDPFFSHQPVNRIARSLFAGKKERATYYSDDESISAGMDAVADASGGGPVRVSAIVSSHSHYDHLMDIPAVFQRLEGKPKLLISASSYNIIHHAIDTSKVTILEKHMSRQGDEDHRSPIALTGRTKINVYPVLSGHNPHFRHVSFFSGEQVSPQSDLKTPFSRSRANLWLEGNTFSFIFDYLDERDSIELRVFIQSSSCNAPRGIPPPQLSSRPADIAFLGVVSYHFSPTYPCALLDAVRPKQIVWVHWEDFFRRYTRKPRTVRGTDIPGFFGMPCVQPYKNSGKILWPRAGINLLY